LGLFGKEALPIKWGKNRSGRKPNRRGRIVWNGRWGATKVPMSKIHKEFWKESKLRDAMGNWGRRK